MATGLRLAGSEQGAVGPERDPGAVRTDQRMSGWTRLRGYLQLLLDGAHHLAALSRAAAGEPYARLPASDATGPDLIPLSLALGCLSALGVTGASQLSVQPLADLPRYGSDAVLDDVALEGRGSSAVTCAWSRSRARL